MGGLSCGDFAAHNGEGRFRADPKTAAFTDASQRGRLPYEPKVDDFVTKVGPGLYHQPSVAGESLTSRGHDYPTTTSDWPRAQLERDKERCQEEVQPRISFDLEIEDRRGWNWDPVTSTMVKPRLSFNKAKRYNRACMETPEAAPCATDYYDTAPALDALERTDALEAGSASAFNSETTRFKKMAGQEPEKTPGPGACGIPYDPNDKAEYVRRHELGQKSAVFMIRDTNVFAERRRIKGRISEGEGARPTEDPTTRGPGCYWTQSMQDLHPMRPKSAESVRGTSGFCAMARKDTKMQKDIQKFRSSMPTSNYDTRVEMRQWIHAARRLGSASAISLPKSGWSGTDRFRPSSAGSLGCGGGKERPPVVRQSLYTNADVARQRRDATLQSSPFLLPPLAFLLRNSMLMWMRGCSRSAARSRARG